MMQLPSNALEANRKSDDTESILRPASLGSENGTNERNGLCNFSTVFDRVQHRYLPKVQYFTFRCVGSRWSIYPLILFPISSICKYCTTDPWCWMKKGKIYQIRVVHVVNILFDMEYLLIWSRIQFRPYDEPRNWTNLGPWYHFSSRHKCLHLPQSSLLDPFTSKASHSPKLFSLLVVQTILQSGPTRYGVDPLGPVRQLWASVSNSEECTISWQR
jgi:hypothetical protein